MIELCPGKLVPRKRIPYLTGKTSGPSHVFGDLQTLDPVYLEPNESTILSLDHSYTFSYGHWLEAYAPLLFLPATRGYEITEVELPATTIQRIHIKQWCNLAGISRSLPTSRPKAKVIHQLSMSLVHPDWIALLRAFIPLALQTYPQPDGQKILLQRCQLGSAWDTSRNLENRHDFIERFPGFSIIYLEDLHILQQIAIFASASIIVGVHGSGMSNVMFCKSGCKVIEIRSPLFWNSTYAEIGSYLDVEFTLILGEERRGNSDLYTHCVYADLDLIEPLIAL